MVEVFASSSAGLLSGLLVTSATAKVRNLNAFGTSLATYGFRNPWRAALQYSVPAVELGLGVALLVDIRRNGALTFAALLLLAFTTVLVWARLRGLSVDCGCMGAGQTSPVSIVAIVRNVGFLAIAVGAIGSDVASDFSVVLLSAVASSVFNLLFAEYLNARVMIRKYA